MRLSPCARFALFLSLSTTPHLVSAQNTVLQVSGPIRTQMVFLGDSAWHPGPTSKNPVKIAVLDFQYMSGMGMTDNSLTGTAAGEMIGKRVAATLALSGVYAVADRDEMERAAGVALLSQRGANEPATAARLGQLLHVDAVLFGDVRDDFGETVTDSEGDYENALTIDARLVDVRTGKPLLVVHAVGYTPLPRNVDTDASGKVKKAKTTPASFDGSGISGSEFKEAIDQASDTLVNGLSQGSAFAMASPSPAGMVYDAMDQTVSMLMSSPSTFRVGERVAITRSPGLVKNPSTGEVLRMPDKTVGYITVADIDGSLARGPFLGESPARAGDMGAKGIR